MTNGNHALRLVEPEIPSTPAVTPPADPSPRAQDPIETAIAEAVAASAVAVAAAVADYMQTGVLDPALKDTGASKLAKIAELQLDHPLGDADFLDRARHAGRRALRQYLPDVSPHRADATVDLFINDMLSIVERVVHDERIFRVAWAN